MSRELASIEFWWADLDQPVVRQFTGPERLFRAILERALNDLLWDKVSADDDQMLNMRDAFAFLMSDNPVFEICRDVMGLPDSRVRDLRKRVEAIFRENYREPRARRRGRPAREQ